MAKRGSWVAARSTLLNAFNEDIYLIKLAAWVNIKIGKAKLHNCMMYSNKHAYYFKIYNSSSYILLGLFSKI